MTIQHKDIPDAQRHEPKGASTAAANSVYVSNGAGSGVFQKIGSAQLQGVTGDGGDSNLVAQTDGLGGFVLRHRAAYGSMTITNNTNNFAVTAAVDPTLQTNSDYVLFTGTGAPWLSENLFGITFNTDRLIAPYTGVYKIDAWANILSYPTNTAFVGIKYRLNGTTFGPRRLRSKSNSVGDAGNVFGFGFVPMTAGDYIQLYVASSATGNLVINDCNSALHLIRQTA